MANSKIYLGSTNIGSLFNGASNISIYLGENKVYPLSEDKKVLRWVEFKVGDTIPSDLDVYGIMGTADGLYNNVATGVFDGIFGDFSRGTYTMQVFKDGGECYSYETTDETENEVIIFSNVSCNDKYVTSLDKIVTSESIYLYIYTDPDYANQPLTLTALEEGVISIVNQYAGSETQYSLDDGATWSELKTNVNTTPTLSVGQRVMWRGVTQGTSTTGSFTFSGTPIQFEAEGNPMSLNMNRTIFNYMSNNQFADLFYNTNITNAENIDFGTIKLGRNSLRSTFSGCQLLTKAPKKLPEIYSSTTSGSCSQMFYNCTSLTTAPELPSTTLGRECYRSMFQGCTSLTKGPSVLPATTLARECYEGMFSGCTSLMTAPELPALTLATYCYQYMFQNCTSLTKAPSVLPALTLATYCYQYMFQGCSSLTTAPELPALDLTSNCYNYMFRYCSKLNYIKAMFTTTPSTSYTSNWVSDVSVNGTFVKNKDATWDVSGINGIPTGWTIETE